MRNKLMDLTNEYSVLDLGYGYLTGGTLECRGENRWTHHAEWNGVRTGMSSTFNTSDVVALVSKRYKPHLIVR